jgi:hypothetical protein
MDVSIQGGFILLTITVSYHKRKIMGTPVEYRSLKCVSKPALSIGLDVHLSVTQYSIAANL